MRTGLDKHTKKREFPCGRFRAFCFLWMVPIVRFFNVSGLFLFRIRFNEKRLVAVEIMFYILMGDGPSSYPRRRRLRRRGCIPSVCLTFSLYTFVLPIGDGGPSTSHLWEKSKEFGKPISSTARMLWSVSC